MTAFHTVENYQGPLLVSIQPYQGITVRCYKCHSTDVASVCHHCGRFLCQAHEAQPKVYQEPSREFVSLLKEPLRKAAHCEDHQHHIFSALKMMIMPGVILVGLGVIWALSRGIALISLMIALVKTVIQEPSLDVLANILPDLLLNLVTLGVPMIILGGGIALTVVGIDRHRRVYHDSEGTELSAIPLIPDHHTIKVEDTVSLKIKIQKGEQSYLEIPSATGTLSFNVYLGEAALATLNAYRVRCEKYGWVPKDTFDLGYLAAQGLQRLTTVGRGYAFKPEGDQFHILAERLDIEELTESGAWREFLSGRYEIDSSMLKFGDGEIMPSCIFWLRPTLEPMGGGRTLRFEIDIAEPFISKAILESLVVKVDRRAFPDAQTEVDLPVADTNGRLYPELWEVRWMDWPLDETRQPRIPFITFVRPVPEMGKPLEILFEVRLDKLVSKLDVQQSYIWLPNGRPLANLGREGLIRRSTQLTGEATIDPSLFSYQYEFAASARFEQEGVELTAEVVKAILEALEEDQIYVKTVVEDAPVVELRDGATHKCCWDVLGRCYARIHPVDVHVVLMGNKPLESSQIGQTSISGEISLRALINSEDRVIEEEVRAKCGDLEEVLRDTLRQAHMV